MKIVKFICILIVVGFVSCKPSKYAHLSDGMYAEINTNKGDILLHLEYEKTPVTVANFVSLAEGTNTNVSDSLKGKPFYNGLLFHRVIANFMIQGGDPLGTGSGGPGYKFDDEFPKDEEGKLILKHDSAGILSMANAGKGTNGSQFFITHKATPWLNGKHTVFGNVVEGQDIVDSIAKNDTIKLVEIIKIGKEAKKFKAGSLFADYMQKKEEERIAREKRLAKVVSDTKALFDTNKAKAKTTKSGLMYLITETKNGQKPASGAKVKVNYAGYFPDGKLFDTNFKEIAQQYEMYNEQRDKQNGYAPFTTEYSNKARLIPGFKEGLQLMNVGDKAMLFIPSNLGYGARGAGKRIPPNADLVFVLELVEAVQ